MPTLRQLHYFLAISTHGGFTPAAAALHVAQPALSRQIALLEDELGFTLFVREARGISLTPAGRQFLERVDGIEQALQSAIEDSRQIGRGEAGVLRLLHSSSLPIERLMPALRQFHDQAPSARIDIDRLSSEQQVGDVSEGRAEIGFIRLPVLRRTDDIALQPLAAERLLAALPSHHPLANAPRLTLAELARERFVSAVHRERGGLARCVTELCLKRGFVPRLAPAISRKTSMLTLVAAGFGIAIVPEGMQALARPDIVLRPLADPDAITASAMILPRSPSPLAAAFAAIARAHLGSAGGTSETRDF
jgi:DNA-binding transcriptional LysR family regulator